MEQKRGYHSSMGNPNSSRYRARLKKDPKFREEHERKMRLGVFDNGPLGTFHITIATVADVPLVKRKTNNKHYCRGGKYLDESERIHFADRNSSSDDVDKSGPVRTSEQSNRTTQPSNSARTQSKSKKVIITYSKKANAAAGDASKKHKTRAVDLKAKEKRLKATAKKVQSRSKRSVKKVSSEKYGKASGNMDVDDSEEWPGLTELGDSDTDGGEEAQESNSDLSDEDVGMEGVEDNGGYGPGSSESE